MSKDNWFSIDFDTPSCKLNFANFKPVSKYEAINHTVRSIQHDFPGKLVVALSGGLDSEFVAETLYRWGVPFKPVIVDYKTNGAEAWNAYYWCREHHITPRVIELDEKFMRKALPFLARSAGTAYSSATDLVIAAAEPGYIITGCPEPFVRENCSDDKLDKFTSNDLYVSTYDFTLTKAFPGQHPGSFFAYTPEMWYSMIKELDYFKPVQLALAEYYGLRPRPKVDALINLGSYIDIAREVNSTVPMHEIQLGNKEELLRVAVAGGVVDSLPRN